MSYKDLDGPSWRDDPGLSSHTFYKRKWAITPVLCSSGEKVLFKHYYSKYKMWGRMDSSYSKYIDGNYGHTDFIENITEAEYIVRKLAENL